MTQPPNLPLGDTMQEISVVLDRNARQWMRAAGYDTVPERADLIARERRWGSPAERNLLKALFIARFRLAVGTSARYHAGENFDLAMRCGATYKEMGEAIGMSRQGVQRRWGLTVEDQEAAANAIAAAVRTLALPVPGSPGGQWSSHAIAHNYDSESDLTAALVTVEEGAEDAPKQVLLFHRGEFLGPATEEAFALTSLVLPKCTDRAAAVEFKESGIVHSASFQWRDGQVKWFGQLHPDATSRFSRGF